MLKKKFETCLKNRQKLIFHKLFFFCKMLNLQKLKTNMHNYYKRKNHAT